MFYLKPEKSEIKKITAVQQSTFLKDTRYSEKHFSLFDGKKIIFNLLKVGDSIY